MTRSPLKGMASVDPPSPPEPAPRTTDADGRRWWITRGDGTRQRVRSAAMLIGRSTDCEVVLLDPRASAYHAILSLGASGPRLLTIGRTPPLVDGVPAERAHVVAAGTTLDFPGERLRLVATGGERPIDPGWALERPGGIVVRPTGRDVLIGGGDEDVCLPGWPAGALSCHAIQGGVVAIPRVPVTVRGQVFSPPAMVALTSGDRVEIDGEGFTFIALGEQEPTATMTPAEVPCATRVRFEFMPTGGKLEIEFVDARASLRLSELRCLLVAALLGAHRAFPAGAAIPDDDLVRLLWPTQLDRTNLHLNQVVHRLREALLAAGVDPLRVIGRDRLGSATWFRLGPDTRLELV